MTQTPDEIAAKQPSFTDEQAMECAETAYSAGNLVTNDGYYEFDLDAAAAIIRDTVRAEVAKALELAARLVERRMEQRFDEFGTREPDTNACYYSGRAGEIYETLDEECEAIATAIRNLKGTDNG